MINLSIIHFKFSLYILDDIKALLLNYVVLILVIAPLKMAYSIIISLLVRLFLDSVVFKEHSIKNAFILGSSFL